MVKVLVSDLGKVILPFDFEPTRDFLRHHRRSASQTIEDPWSVFSNLYADMGFGTGKCTGEEFFQALSMGLNLNCDYADFCIAFSDVFTENCDVASLIFRSKAQLRCLLSNTNVIHWNWILDHHAACLNGFDFLLASHELGLQKPSPEIYRKVECITGLPFSCHLLIDDMFENVEGAQACGWDAILYTSTVNLERELRQRNLLD